jgi:hypothetical protein
MAQRAYCIANPGGFVGYGPNNWGLTASDGPFGYNARGAPPAQNDDGTLTPTAPASSIAFAPGVVIPTLHNLYDTYGASLFGTYGFKDAFNPTVNWFDTDFLGIDQGPIVMMIENYRTQAIWNRFMQNPDVQRGLTRAGFTAAPNTDAGPDPEIDTVRLFQNAPNPFRDTAQIAFRLPQAGRVTLALYDVAGHRVRSVFDAVQPAGAHQVELRATGLPSGIYWYRLEYGGKRITRQCIVVH